MDMKVHLLAVTLLLYGNVVYSQTVTIDFATDPTVNIRKGQQILLTCRVNGSFYDDTDTLVIQRVASDGVAVRLASEEGIDAGAPNNVQFAGWNPYNNAYVMYVSISDIGRADRGNYTCIALRQQSIETYETLAQQTVAVDVRFPPSGDPSCEMSPSKLNFTCYEGDTISLRCTSDIGNPPVPVQWSYVHDTDNLPSIPKPKVRKSQYTIEYILFLPMNTDFDGVTFYCKRKSDASADDDGELCTLGPFTVLNAPTKDWLIPVIAVTAVFAVISISLIIFLLVRSQRCKLFTATTNTAGINRADISFHITNDYEQLPAEENHENISSDYTSGMSPNGCKGRSIVQKSKSKKKTYPDPPNYPRPPKHKGEKPYANAEIGSPMLIKGTETEFKYPEETKASASSKTGNTKAESEQIVYANTLDVGTGVSQKPASSSNKHLPAPTEAPPPPPPEEASNMP